MMNRMKKMNGIEYKYIIYFIDIDIFLNVVKKYQ